MSIRNCSRYFPFLFAIFCGFPLRAVDWMPVDPADLANKTPKVEKDADAEILLWDVRVSDQLQGEEPQTILTHYLRMQLYNDRAIQKYGNVDIYLGNKTGIQELAARVIAPDGTITEVEKKAIFNRDVVKTGGRKVRAVSFALPKLAPGSIVEYRYREIRQDQLANYLRLYFQREIPIRTVSYHIKPLQLPWLPYAMRVRNFQLAPSPFKQEPQGFYETHANNVPAYREEGSAPPEDTLKAWMLIYYAEDKKLSEEKFWREKGKEYFSSFKQQLKLNDELKKLAAELTAGRASDEEKLAALSDWVRKNMKNMSYDAEAELNRAERKRLAATQNSAEFFKLRAGYQTELNMVMAALATAAGYEVRIIRIPDRGDVFFAKDFLDTYLLRASAVGVKTAGGWKYYDPGTPWLAPGMLRWEEEGVPALAPDSKEPAFIETPQTPAEGTVSRRTGKLTLDLEGTLSGEVSVEMTGHFATEERAVLYGKSEADQAERVKNYWESRIGAGEITGAKVLHFEDLGKPLIYRANVSIPGFAERTGKRFFFPPNAFEKGRAARFPESKRVNPIYLHYASTVKDSIQINFPAGYALEEAEAPQSSKIGDIGEYKVSIKKANDDSFVLYEREFIFPRSGASVIPASSYAQLKQVFDFVHQQDHHTLTLREKRAQ